jgi:hypothetical protein
VFEVIPVVTLSGFSHTLEATRRILGPALKGSWYHVSVPEALSAVAKAMIEDELSEPSLESDRREPAPGAPRLEELFEPCPSTEANKACELVNALKGYVGVDIAKQLLQDTRQVCTADVTGVKRRVLKMKTSSRGEALRFRPW